MCYQSIDVSRSAVCSLSHSVAYIRVRQFPKPYEIDKAHSHNHHIHLSLSLSDNNNNNDVSFVRSVGRPFVPPLLSLSIRTRPVSRRIRELPNVRARCRERVCLSVAPVHRYSFEANPFPKPAQATAKHGHPRSEAIEHRRGVQAADRNRTVAGSRLR